MKLKIWEYIIIGLITLILAIGAVALDQKLTVSYTPVGFTADNYTNAQSATIYVEGNDIRVTMDGVTAPTSAGVGIKLAKDTLYTDLLTSNSDIANFKAVRISTTDATVNAVFKWPQRLK